MHDVGAKVHTLKGLKLHAKMIVADDKRAVVGSINLAPGSFDARRELAIETDAHHVVKPARRGGASATGTIRSRSILPTRASSPTSRSATPPAPARKCSCCKGHAQEEGQATEPDCSSRHARGRDCRHGRVTEVARSSAMAISVVVFAVVLAATALGIFLNRILPEHHLSKESKEIIHLGIGVIVTLTALVLGLLVASAKGSFDTKSDEIRQSSVKIIMVDQLPAPIRAGGQGSARPLAPLGRRSTPRRSGRRRVAACTAEQGNAEWTDFHDKLRALAPANDAQRRLQAKVTRPHGRARAERDGFWPSRRRARSRRRSCWCWCCGSASSSRASDLFAPRNGTVYVVIVPVRALVVDSRLSRPRARSAASPAPFEFPMRRMHVLVREIHR